MDGQLGFYAAQPLVDLRLEVNGMADSNQGLGDLILGGMLGWHQGNHHWIAALETVLGTGEYDTPSTTHPVEANLGKNYHTIRPIIAYSYANAAGLDLSTKLSYSWNTRNDATDYKSDNTLRVTIAWVTALTPNSKLQLKAMLLNKPQMTK